MRPQDKSGSGAGSFPVWVGSLADTVMENVLMENFQQFGPISSVKLMRDNATNQTRNFGYVNFCNQDDAYRAAQQMTGVNIHGNLIKTKDPSVVESLSTKRNKDEEGSGTSTDPVAFTIWVGGLADDVGEEELQNEFQRFGEIQSVRLQRDENGATRNFGFISYNHAKEAENAARGMDKQMMLGTEIRANMVDKTQQADKKVGSRPRVRQGQEYCRDEQKPRGCGRGSECRYKHVRNGEPPPVCNVGAGSSSFPQPLVNRNFNQQSPQMYNQMMGNRWSQNMEPPRGFDMGPPSGYGMEQPMKRQAMDDSIEEEQWRERRDNLRKKVIDLRDCNDELYDKNRELKKKIDVLRKTLANYESQSGSTSSEKGKRKDRDADLYESRDSDRYDYASDSILEKTASEQIRTYDVSYD